MKNKAIKKSLYLLILAGMIGIGTTSAYFSAYDNINNQMAVGRNETEIEEYFPGPTPTPAGEDLEFLKTVVISNNNSGENMSDVECYVRAMISYSNYDIGKAISLIGLDTSNWIFNSSDGYYYYKKSLEKGESTTPLMKGFKVDQSEVDKQYLEKIGDFHINIYEESVQKGEFQDYISAWDYYLNPIGDF